MQLVDELSMIYTASLMCYATFSFSQSRIIRQVLGVGLLSLDIFITVSTQTLFPIILADICDNKLYYHYLQDPIFHQNAFAILTAVVLFRSMYVMEINIRPSLKAKWGTTPQKYADPTSLSKEDRIANEHRDRKILKDMWLMVALGLSIFLGGFGIWALDNQFCSTVRVWRHKVGLPWGILLEGHGWWLVNF